MLRRSWSSRNRWLPAAVMAIAAAAAGCQQRGEVIHGQEARAVMAPMEERRRKAAELMMRFAERTGVTGDGTHRRYLWTDAFAVCNLLGLGRPTGEERYTELALRLVDRVHHTLGRHRPDDPRTGWISGLGEREGPAHPTRGGLRIGKELPERGPDEPANDRLEWDRDGQYFHYLTKWMHALDQVTRSTRRPVFNAWARELAATAHAAFTYRHPITGRGRMYWKMSIDLSRPLVPSMGQHDPLDGYVTSIQLQATAALSAATTAPGLAAQTAEFRSMLGGRDDLATTDPLGLGGLLVDAYRLEQLRRQGVSVDEKLVADMLAAALAGLEHWARQSELRQPAAGRLAFRELGLAIGLHAVALMWQASENDPRSFAGGKLARTTLEGLMRHVDLREDIESFWLDPEHRAARAWTDHRDINEVMLATSLLPEGFLVLQPVE